MIRRPWASKKSLRAMAEASTQLRDLLCHARPSWCSKELDAVQGKLERIGVRSVQHLLLELQQDSLNEPLSHEICMRS